MSHRVVSMACIRAYGTGKLPPSQIKRHELSRLGYLVCELVYARLEHDTLQVTENQKLIAKLVKELANDDVSIALALKEFINDVQNKYIKDRHHLLIYLLLLAFFTFLNGKPVVVSHIRRNLFKQVGSKHSQHCHRYQHHKENDRYNHVVK